MQFILKIAQRKNGGQPLRGGGRSRRRRASGERTVPTDGSCSGLCHSVMSREESSSGMEQLPTSMTGNAPKMNCVRHKRILPGSPVWLRWENWLRQLLTRSTNRLLQLSLTANFCLRWLDGAASNPDELRAAITEIVNDGTRASTVISRIRGLLKKRAPNRTEIDINQIIQDATMPLRNEFTRNRLFLRTELAANLPRVLGDPVLLQQVLINLIMNAIEAMSTSDGRREILIRSARNADGDFGPGSKFWTRNQA